MATKAAKAKPVPHPTAKVPTAPTAKRSTAPVTTGETSEEMEEPKPVVSSMVAEVAYSPESEELEVTFVNGHVETYQVDQSVYEGLLSTTSVGKYMWEWVLE